MNSYKEIGGYFSLELNTQTRNIHEKAIFVNSGRHALELILKNTSNIKCLWIPYYTCEVVLEPLIKLNIPYSFYNINEELELAQKIDISDGEYILYTNYFGIKDTYINKLNGLYGDKLIVDCAQAYFYTNNSESSALYSPRKFFGIPDGGLALINKNVDLSIYPMGTSFDSCTHLLKRIDLGAGAAYNDFKINDEKLKNEPIKQMSRLTRSLLSSIDFDTVKQKRLDNFTQIHKALGGSNLLNIDSFGNFACPMVYPYYTEDTALRGKLIENKIFVATYWPNVLKWCNETDTEYKLTKNIIPIPIDQRYGTEDMEYIINVIKQ